MPEEQTQPETTVEQPSEGQSEPSEPTEQFDIEKFMASLNSDIKKDELDKMNTINKATDDKISQVAKALMNESSKTTAKLADIIQNQNKAIEELTNKLNGVSIGSQAPPPKAENPFVEKQQERTGFDEHNPEVQKAFFKRFNIM